MKGFELFKPNVEKMKARRDVDGLIKALRYGIGSEKGKGAEVRLGAITALGLLGDKRAVEPISQLLSDEDWSGQILIEGAKVLIALDAEKAVQPIGRLLGHAKVTTSMEIIEMLEKLGDKRFVEPLIHALDDSRNLIQNRAARALGNMGDERAIEPLMQVVMRGPGWMATAEAELALKELGKANLRSPAITTAVQELKNRRARARSSAARTLLAVGWKPTNEEERIDYLVASGGFDEVARMGRSGVERLVEILRDPLESDNDVRMRAAGSLGGEGSDRAVEALIEALRDRNGGVRNHAARALGFTGDSRAVEPLIRALEHGEGGISSSRVFAAQALGMMKDERAVGPLRKASETGDKWLREAAADALTQLKAAGIG